MADRVAILRKGVLQDVGTPAEVYNRPATLYVAAFLGNPRMNLIEAQIHVHLDRRVALHIGDQVLNMPWSDMRARQVAHYHGERIVLGMRAEALTPVPTTTTGDVLHGRLRYVEHHGHESLAYVDVGAMAIEMDDLGGAVPDDLKIPTSTWSRLKGLFNGRRPASPFAHDVRGHNGRKPPPGAVPDGAGRHHRRRADIAVRLPAYPNVAVGQLVSVGVNIGDLHFFEGRDGHRIDVGRR